MIIVEPCAGLGNRFIALASAYHIAKKLNRELVVIWKEETVLGAPMNALFKLPADVKCIEITEYGYKGSFFGQIRGNLIKKKYRSRAGRFFECDDIMNLYNEKGMDGVIAECEKHDVVYVKATNPFCDIYSIEHAFDFITPKESIKEHKDAVIKAARGRRLVGVHIRRTDHIDAIKNSPLELFIQKMQDELKANGDTYFYVATDDTATEKQLVDLFGEKIITFKNKTLDRNSRKGIEDAYVEMLCLSAGEKILGSFNSTFSLMASRLGNIPLEVVKL